MKHSPQRLQRPRRKGAPLPEGAVYVGRPTLWGNPFMERPGIGHAQSVILHSKWLEGRIGARMLENMGFSLGEIEALDRLRLRVLHRLPDLAGKDLTCWCPLTSDWCHAATLLNLANHMPRIAKIAAALQVSQL
jgi:hypothetical protein